MGQAGGIMSVCVYEKREVLWDSCGSVVCCVPLCKESEGLRHLYITFDKKCPHCHKRIKVVEDDGDVKP